MNKDLSKPKAIGSPPGAFKIALDVLKKIGAKKILDCPAGEGPFSRLLIDNGYNIVSGDVYPDQFKLSEISCDFVDLNDKLPYEDDAFDAVACLNGLQRIWARGRAMSEFARVIKPGGYAIISFPNNSDIRRRLLFMLTGSVTWNVIGPPNACSPEVENPASCFRYPMTLANVLSAVTSVGMKYKSVHSTHYSKSALFLLPLVLGPILFSKFSPKKYKNVYDKDLFKIDQTSSLDALLGAFLVVVAQKPYLKPPEAL
jgi:SAM-dependent methyltransferase